jgi:3-oxoacyl-[acyl-carrier-protein] synthase III
MIGQTGAARHCAITAWGSCTPGQVLDNAELIDRFGLDVTPQWIEERTGIQRRHWLHDGESTSDIAARAATQILERRGITAADLDRIILATISPDHISPATATIVARKIGARCPAFDVSAACAGFLYGLDLGQASILSGASKVLVLAADARSRFIDKHDRRASVLFADGAAGVLLERTSDPGLLAIHLGAEGREAMGAHVPAGGALMPATAETVARGLHHLVVDPSRDIFDTFVRYTRESCDAVLESTGLLVDEIDVFIAHQGNARLVELIAKDLGLRDDQVINDVYKHGNTAGASIPIVLAEALDDGRAVPGDTILMTSAGAGYVYGAAVIRI